MPVRPHPDFVRAGQIAARVLQEVMKEVKSGVEVLRVCRLAEMKIREYGGQLAFPCNISINNEAAHYTSPYGDTRVFPERGLVKIDLGANVNGHLSDTAQTVDLDGSFERFIVAAQKALDAAIEVVRPGVRLGEVGAAIEIAIKSEGLKPVHQLSGHQLKPNNLHAGKNVPNIRTRTLETMNLGDTFAIEPFATDGSGGIKADQRVYIFSNNMKNTKKLDRIPLQVRNIARKRFGTVPWASRWLYDMKNDFEFSAPLITLVHANVINAYPVLLEAKDGMVSQAEHSIFVAENGAIATTRFLD